MKLWQRAVTGTVAAGVACFAWGLAEAKAYTVRRASLEVLPAGSRPIRVLHLSDIHLLAKHERKLGFLRDLASFAPDLVVNTGDNISEAGAIAPLIQALAAVGDVPGVFVFGSNDYRSPSFRNPLQYLIHGKSQVTDTGDDLPWVELKDQLESFGWQDLTHRRVTVEVAGLRLAFRGTDDAHLGRDDYSLVAGPKDDSADLNIGVTHAPYLRLLDAMAADGMDMIFAGHTHGGQVCIPGYGALLTNCDLDTKRVKGLSTHTCQGNTAQLHVSGGLGTSPFAPYRFACRPEVTLLTLNPISH